ncbi:phage tail tape measure protein [Photorhabdus laumondii]|uniref:phage tail tape measure protein n=1 Tax=Photorhabdus laumondii TaxID=2218628 RepID=UPI0007B4E69C|nr:phage tail tape measure protein [Photorhabdus laumondii]MCC8389276.1 phage tail tape measure protein [Photorhabdus laumondii]MCZ1250566.1 phage tail tape measure protein [Photorhabdus laumondii subsp. laumondii]
MADVASLAVALHLNAASFKSQVVDAYRSAATESKKFSAGAQQDSLNTSTALAKVGQQAKSAGAQINQFGGSLNRAQGGVGHLRYVLDSLAAGSNVAASSLTGALVPAIEKTFGNINTLSFSLQEQKRAAAEVAAQSMRTARAQIEQAQSARTSAQSQFQLAKRAREQAIAQREQAFALDEHYARQVEINKQYGVTAKYTAEHAKNARAIEEANIAEAAAKEKMLTATRAIVAADKSESDGKRGLLVATNQMTAANRELSFGARAAAASTNLLRSSLALMGGPVGVAVLATVAAFTALWSHIKSAEEQQKAFNAAIMKGGTGLTTTAYDLEQLSLSLGGTAEAIKSVTAAAAAGLTGDMLTQVSALGKRLEEAGGSVDNLISRLVSIGNEPLKALESLTNQGMILDATIVQQIANLERAGKTEEAKELARAKALQAEKKQHEESLAYSKKQTEQLKNLTTEWGYLATAIGTTSAIQLQAMQDAEREKVLAKQAEENRQRQKTAQQQKQDAIDLIKTENQITAAVNAGIDPQKERARLTKEIKARHDAGKMSVEQYAQALKGLDKMYSSPSKSFTDSEGVRRLQELREQTATLKAQANESVNLTASQRKLVAFEQEIADFKGKRLTDGQKSLFAMKEEIAAQLKQNILLEKANEQRELSKKLHEQTRDMVARTYSLQQDADNQIAQITMPSADYDQMVAEQQIRDDFRQRRWQLDKEVSDKTSALYVEQTGILQSEQQRQLDIVRNTAQQKAEVEGSFSSGLKKGFSDWGEGANNAFTNMRDISTKALDGMANSLTELATTGKASFGDMAKSIIKDLASMTIKMAMFNAVKAGMSFFGFGGGSAPSPTLNAKGGIYSSPSLSAYSGQIVSSPTLFAFAKGATGLMGEAGPEAILPLKRGPDGSLGVRASGSTQSGTAAPQVYITISDNGQISQTASPGLEQFGSSIGQFVDSRYRELRDKDLRPGGPLWRR